MCFYWSIFAFNIPESHIKILIFNIDIDQIKRIFTEIKTVGFELADFPKLL